MNREAVSYSICGNRRFVPILDLGSQALMGVFSG
jgi:hypothetical protein